MAGIGDILGGKYRLHRLLGEGGMGAVYAAENLNTGRRVAIKTLRGEWTEHPEVVKRFLREARATTTIAHPNVVEVLDLDVDRDLRTPYIVQEFLEGRTLEAHLAAQPGERLPAAEALAILVPVMGALVTAHARGIVHRDLKPANLFLARGRGGVVVPKVIDFGIAKNVDSNAAVTSQTQAGTAIGTPAYMSPEQVAGLADIDAQTDVWSLGVVLYETLSGRLPYDADNVNVLMGKILYEAPVLLEDVASDVPADLVAVVARALCRDRAQRFRSVADLLAAVLASPSCPAALASSDALHGALPPAFDAAADSHDPDSVATQPRASATPAAPASNVPGDTLVTVARSVDEPSPSPGRGRFGGLGAVAVAVVALVAVAGVLSLRGAAPTRGAPRAAAASASPVVAPRPATEPPPTAAVAPSVMVAPAVVEAPVVPLAAPHAAPHAAPIAARPVARPALRPVVSRPLRTTPPRPAPAHAPTLNVDEM